MTPKMLYELFERHRIDEAYMGESRDPIGFDVVCLDGDFDFKAIANEMSIVAPRHLEAKQSHDLMVKASVRAAKLEGALAQAIRWVEDAIKADGDVASDHPYLAQWRALTAPVEGDATAGPAARAPE